MTFNKFQVWKDDSVTTRRFETSLKLFYPLSFIKWLKLTLFLSKIICLTCSMWHWKWKYIFTKIDTGYGLCDISYQDWQHCRLNICKRNILVELTNTVYVNSTNVTSNIETAVLSVSSIKVEHCFQKNHTILQILFSIVSTFSALTGYQLGKWSRSTNWLIAASLHPCSRSTSQVF